MNSNSMTRAAALAAIAFLGASCGGSKEPPAPATGDAGSPQAASVLADSPPQGALGVVDARAAAKPGEPIVLRGKVGGKMTPISDSAAILVLADEKAIASCDQIPGDDCKTPWDYCCELPSVIADSTATIQVKDGAGKVMRSTLRGVGGLKELSHLVVAGTVDAASTADALIVNATQIHVEKP